MKNKSLSPASAVSRLSRRLYRREHQRYLIVELIAFAIITAASAFAILDAVAFSII